MLCLRVQYHMHRWKPTDVEKSCRYDTLKGMNGNDDAFGLIELHNV